MTNLPARVREDSVVVSLMQARTALAAASTIQQAKAIADVAAAAEIYAQRQHLGEEAERMAASIKVEALRKLGEMLKETPKATGAKGIGTSAVPNGNHTLSDLGLSKKESMVAQKLAGLSDEQFEQVRDGHVSVSKAIAAVQAAKPAKPEPKAAPVEIEDIEPDDDLLADLQAEVERLSAENKALAAEDGKAELLKAIRAKEHAQREQAAAMDRAARATDREAWTMRQLRRVCKAVGEDDPAKVAAAVEAMVRAARRERA